MCEEEETTMGADSEQERCDVPLVTCPECGNVASIEWQSWISDVLHLKLRCVNRHWFDFVCSGP